MPEPATPPPSSEPDVEVGSGRTEMIAFLVVIVLSLVAAVYTFYAFPGLNSTIDEARAPALSEADSLALIQEEATVRALTTYGVADSARGTFHMPIDTAITLLLRERGAPGAQGVVLPE